MSDEVEKEFQRQQRRYAKRHGYDYEQIHGDEAINAPPVPLPDIQPQSSRTERQRRSLKMQQIIADQERVNRTPILTISSAPWKIIKGVLWLVFIMPGGLITWKEYYFPRRGKVYATGRRRNNTAVKVIFSIAVWIPILVVIGLLYWIDQNKQVMSTFWGLFKSHPTP